MPTFKVTGGALTLDSVGSNYPSNELPGGGQIDNSLPGLQPGIDNSLPEPPPGIWPPPTIGNPIAPIIDNTLPVAPGTIWPSPGRPPHIDAGLPVQPGHPGGGPMPGGERPDNTLPGGQGGQIDNALPSKTYWMLCYCPALGWRFIAVDPSLRPGMPLPPHAQPK
jgi:hypothetical protein